MANTGMGVQGSSNQGNYGPRDPRLVIDPPMRKRKPPIVVDPPRGGGLEKMPSPRPGSPIGGEPRYPIRKDAGITGPGGGSVDKLYNTY